MLFDLLLWTCIFEWKSQLKSIVTTTTNCMNKRTIRFNIVMIPFERASLYVYVSERFTCVYKLCCGHCVYQYFKHSMFRVRIKCCFDRKKRFSSCDRMIRMHICLLMLPFVILGCLLCIILVYPFCCSKHFPHSFLSSFYHVDDMMIYFFVSIRYLIQFRLVFDNYCCCEFMSLYAYVCLQCCLTL